MPSSIRPQPMPAAPMPLVEAFRAPPALSSAASGWRNLSAFVWRADIEDYRVSPTIAEVIVALHTEGIVERLDDRGRHLDRSTPGRVSLLPVRAGGTYRGSGAVGMTTVHLHNERLRGLLPDEIAFARLADTPIRFGVDDPFVAASIRALVAELAMPGAHGALYADAIGDSLALHLLRSNHAQILAQPRRTRLTPRALKTVRAVIEDRLADDLSLDDLAEAVGLSRYHFARAFKQSTGHTPHGFITYRRIEKAKELLRARAMPLAMIALEVGFAGQSRFCESFRRVTGLTPTEFRRLA